MRACIKYQQKLTISLLFFFSFTEGVEYLLRQRNIEVNVKDKKGNRTPLFCAIKAGDEESVVFLIANGADLEQKVAGKNLNDYLRSKMPHIDPHAISIVKPKLEKQTSVSTLEKLKDMIEDLQVTFSEKKKMPLHTNVRRIKNS